LRRRRHAEKIEVGTPGERNAEELSTDLIVAWASGERTTCMCRVPCGVIESVYRLRPVIRRASSLRVRARPTSVVVGAGVCSVVVI